VNRRPFALQNRSDRFNHLEIPFPGVRSLTLTMIFPSTVFTA
jgi:hypothetical protein